MPGVRATPRTRPSPTRSRRSARSSTTTPAEVAAKKAEAAVRELFGDDSVAPQLRALVGAGETRDLSREELFEAWRRFLERLAARYPLVLVLEDIHWADDGLLDFIDHVADWAQGPIMVIATRARRAVREAADVGRRQAQRDLDLPGPAVGGRGRGDARRSAAGTDRAGAQARRSSSAARAIRSSSRRSSAS